MRQVLNKNISLSILLLLVLSINTRILATYVPLVVEIENTIQQQKLTICSYSIPTEEHGHFFEQAYQTASVNLKQPTGIEVYPLSNKEQYTKQLAKTFESFSQEIVRNHKSDYLWFSTLII